MSQGYINPITFLCVAEKIKLNNHCTLHQSAEQQNDVQHSYQEKFKCSADLLVNTTWSALALILFLQLTYLLSLAPIAKHFLVF